MTVPLSEMLGGQGLGREGPQIPRSDVREPLEGLRSCRL